MMTMLVRRLRRQEGFAMVIAILLLAIMTVSMVVALEAGNSALRTTDRSVKWARALAVAETGIENAKTTLSQSRSATSTCPIAGSTPCSTQGGQYKVTWTTAASGNVTVQSIGYYPTMADALFTREVQISLVPAPAFTYALFSNATMEVKNNAVVSGNAYSTGSMTVKQNATICGSVTSATGSITMESNTLVTKQLDSIGCEDKTGAAWAGGSIANAGTTVIWGDATASGSTGCSVTGTSYTVIGGTIYGDVTACGKIQSVLGYNSIHPGTSSTAPAVQSLPTYSYVDSNYPGRHCYPSTGTCGSTNTSATAYSQLNTALNASNTRSGTYVAWQTSPTHSTMVNFASNPGNQTITLNGDLTIITNAPFTFGNTTTITSTGAYELVIISTYVPPTGTTCDVNLVASSGGDCSVYSGNSVVIDNGTDTDLTDKIALLVYTPGKMAIKNNGLSDGALYAGSLDVKNGFDVQYNGRIASVLGFGSGLQQGTWQELAD